LYSTERSGNDVDLNQRSMAALCYVFSFSVTTSPERDRTQR
jgi:hypothetical protein